MIRIDRNRPDPSSNFTAPIQPSPTWLELAQTSTAEALADGAAHTIKEHVYRHQEVRKALETLFNDKCAYCESQVGTTSSWDVEHFRPKSRVENRPDHPGYYWLAYKWTNLYPACPLCNQRRRDPSLRDDPRELPAKGKGDQFPLEDEAQRAMSPADDITRERPLLLDPCDPEEDPEDHFIYDVQGEIHARHKEDRRALETIEIYHLQRRRLQKARAKVLHHVVQTAKLLDQARAMRRPELAQLLEDMLQRFLADDAQYAGLARAVVRDRLAFTVQP